MKVLYCSDSHWGFSMKGNIAWHRTLADVANKHDINVILLGGDNGSHRIDHEVEFFKLVRATFPAAQISWVPGNHTFYGGLDTPSSTLSVLKKAGDESSVAFLPDSVLVDESVKVVITGVASWYERIPERMNDHRMIPNFRANQEWFTETAERTFAEAIRECAAFKSKGYTTVLVSHFPFFHGIKDWKGAGSGDYFGAPLAWESQVDSVDLVLFGHTHIRCDGYAKNGTTRILNPGSDYERPAFQILEL